MRDIGDWGLVVMSCRVMSCYEAKVGILCATDRSSWVSLVDMMISVFGLTPTQGSFVRTWIESDHEYSMA